MFGVERVHFFFSFFFVSLNSLFLFSPFCSSHFFVFSFLERSSGWAVCPSTHPLIGFNLFDRRRRAQAVRVHSDDIFLSLLHPN